MANIIDAIIHLITNPQIKIKEYSKSNNRANSMGEAFEEYIKDVFADTVNEKNQQVRNRKISDVFSYLGNQNNPPDLMLKNGDAIEIKKIESNNSSLALNSSYPKAKLFSDSPMIKNACRECEKWTVKDMIYAVGVVKDGNIRSLAFVYGDDYCADKSTYEQIKSVIKNGVENIGNVEFTKTRELGKISRVDPLGITYLRVRGMWGIENPFSVFKYVYERDFTKDFNFMAIINSDKFYSFNNHRQLETMCKNIKNFNIIDVEIKNPNNPAKLKIAKLITFDL